ncbi:hypothetical protein SDC9_60727 [bioreactor metagenome]|uniref:Uncharacterized protein n=1 Tax=bioreactor metagenome TaxID=1076179 RepID=A0A644XDU2_9ZZZZ
MAEKREDVAVGGGFDGHRSAGDRRHPEDEVEGVLGPVGDEDLVRRHGNAVGSHAGGDGLPKAFVAPGIPVPQQGGPFLPEGPSEGSAEPLQRKQAGIHC